MERRITKFFIACKRISKKFFAFSLVELMISLITISCIAAAFAPVISKKLKANNISVVPDSNLITDQCLDPEKQKFFSEDCELCTDRYCIKCNLTCPKGQYVDTGKCECKDCTEKYGDMCKECDTKTCTLCNYGYYLIGLDGKTYTTCQKCGKTAGRDNICMDGINEQPADYCDNPPSGYVCKGNELRKCSSVYQSSCSTCDKNYCKSCNSGYTLSASNTCINCGSSCSQCNRSDLENCTSCGGQAVMYTASNGKNKCMGCSSAIAHCGYCNGNYTQNTHKCDACVSGYYLSGDKKSCIACSSIANCFGCDSSKCLKCNKGYYADSNGKCVACSVSNCAQCDKNGVCKACNKGYQLKNNQCELNNQGFSCSDSNFMKIGKLCVTRKNMGDSGVLPIPSTVTVAQWGSEYCSSDTTNCCWKGNTYCSDGYSTYSGCGRTACNLSAAKEICKNFSYAGLKWRLPTVAEMADWNVYSQDLGDNGLQLCDNQPDYKSNRCNMDSGCLGNSWDNHCEIYQVWAETPGGKNTTGNEYILHQGRWWQVHYDIHYSCSVRCVADMEE